MTDEMVLKAQKWVNATYGSVAGYNRCTEDGRTGWETIYSLTRALQHELGITTLSDNFGPTTMSLLNAYGNVGVSSSNRNMRTIAEAALYCKGYNGGNLDGLFNGNTQIGLTLLNTDMGFDNGLVTAVTPKVFKALLTMDAYVLLNDGDASIRTCQQWLNRQYLSRGNFFIGPCDGLFSRAMQQALVLAIQYELGMTDSQVTGYIGPGTQSGLKSSVARVSKLNGSATWIRLFQTAVACNRYGNAWGDSGGSWSDALTRSVAAFQEFCQLDRTGGNEGAGTYETWMSLLVSTGDPDRIGKAIDVMYPLTNATIATVKAAGYQYVGRYLTGGSNKVLTNAEIALIFDNDMSIFPLYQEWGDNVQYFSYNQGYAAGQAAATAANGFGIADGTTIYFSVDFDALDTEITNYVIPHFRGVADAVRQSPHNYAIGVYGCRNVCIRLSKAGLTSRSFVSGMSTGYSGNLGFPLPENWAFDQIKNKTIGSGSGALEIDNDIVSGRDTGVSSVSRPRDPNDTWYAYLVWVEARATEYTQANGGSYTIAEMTAQWLRALDSVNDIRYGPISVSNEVFGAYDEGFVNWMRNYPHKKDLLPPRDPAYLWDSDPSHFGASFGGVITNGFPSGDLAGMADFGSWGGDLLSVLGQVYEAGTSASGAYAQAMSLIAVTASNTYFDRKDFFADVDAVVMGTECRNNRTSYRLSEAFQRHYRTASTARARFSNFASLRFGSSPSRMQAMAGSMFDSIAGGRATVIRDAFWLKDFGGVTCPTPAFVDSGVRAEVARAWSSTLLTFANS
ncbi:glycoside hydrolase domain-containing protein [Micromonospora aurantiaca (nom. illeg.)]|uniref:glycoside hydrolase domain-containing protein n=1 Tax=Micromonospora aurantiaca (nom. illeg.) TaxID=47850 RepID=UPI003F4A0C92